MKCHVLTFLCLIFYASVVAQNVPEVKLKNNKTLKLSELHVKVNVTGNLALTTYHMTFYNGTNRVLEGELAFPLGQGQSVTDFAMDVNGELRHAVIVEKELGRVAYENTIRQTIDPGLLEMTKGNNYRARIYPIPAKGYKTLEVTYEQVLKASNKKHSYVLPLQFKKPISEFSLELSVHGKKQVRFTNNKLYKPLSFSNKQGVKKAFFKRRNFTPKQSISFEMALENAESLATYNEYFNYYMPFEPKKKLKTKPETITVFWDASYSMSNRNLKKEIGFLDSYFDYLKNVRLNLVVFNLKVKREKMFEIINGNWSELKKELESVVYDGGTSNKGLSDYKSDEYLFFSDGMFNLGNFNITENQTVYTINSLASANHSLLAQIATQTGGNYINLANQSLSSAYKTVTNEAYLFLGTVNNEDVHEVYPNGNAKVNEDFSLTGKFKRSTALQLLFGYKNKPTDTIEIAVNKGVNNRLVKRIWAKEKMESLRENSEKNKNEIIELAKKKHLITAYTSMIILDRIEDYVRYKIEPPLELKSRYKELVKIEEANERIRLEQIVARKQDLYGDYSKLFDWYNTDFSKIGKVKEIAKQENNARPVTTEQVALDAQTEGVRQSSSQIGSREGVDPSKRIVVGAVKDADGLPLTGVNIHVAGTNYGVITDFNGNYAINAEVGDILTFSFIGYVSHQITLNPNTNVNVSLTEDLSQLNEVVVVGFGTQKKEAVVGSIAQVRSENVEDALNGSIIDALQGRILGAVVQNSNSNNSNATNPNIRIKGRASMDSFEPLYVIDGLLYSGKAIKNIATETIHAIRILKNGEGSSIYGSRASNGVILITTKEGLKKHEKRIQDLNKKLNKEIQFKPWSPNADYLVDLSKSGSVGEAYSKYLASRAEYKNTPTFFMDVAAYFDSINEKDLALQIVTNLIEIELDNHELIKALAYKLEYFKEYDLAVYAYEEVLKLRPEEPHSYRDLALALEQVGGYQKAFDLLYGIMNGDLLEKDETERFNGIEHIAYVEVCRLASKYGDKLNLSDNQKESLKQFNVDIRVVIDWNHDNTDLDLWVVNPESERVLFSNKRSKDGGRISEDLTEGYGPEEFMIKKASKGNYEVLVDYYGDEVQKISGPTTLKVTIFTNYGRKNETKEVRVLRLDKEEEEIEVGTVSI